MLEYEVSTSMFSFGDSLPIYNFFASVANPNSASFNWGKSTKLPDRCCIFEIWIIDIMASII